MPTSAPTYNVCECNGGECQAFQRVTKEKCQCAENLCEIGEYCDFEYGCLPEKQCKLNEIGPCSCYIENDGETKIVTCDAGKVCTDQMCSATSTAELTQAFLTMFLITFVLVILIVLFYCHVKKVKKLVRCLLCSFLASKKSYEEQLEGSKIFSIYLNVVENPNVTSKNPKFTNAQLALQTDLYDGKVEWTGNFWQDYKYYVWKNHPVISMFRYNPVDLYQVNDRVSIFYMSLLLSFFFAFCTSQADTSCAQLKEEFCVLAYAWSGISVVTLNSFQFIAKLIATCSCLRSCSNRCFDCSKNFGQFWLLNFSLFTLCVLVYTMTLAARANSFVSFFSSLAVQNLTSWFLGCYIAFYSFYSQRNSNREDREKFLKKSKSEDDKRKKKKKYFFNKTVPKVVADEDLKALPSGIFEVDITETLEKITIIFPERGILFGLSIVFPIFICLNDTNDFTFNLKKEGKLKEQEEGVMQKKPKLEE